MFACLGDWCSGKWGHERTTEGGECLKKAYKRDPEHEWKRFTFYYTREKKQTSHVQMQTDSRLRSWLGKCK